MAMDDLLRQRLDNAALATDAALDRLLAEGQPGEAARPARLVSAMRYAALSPGKRIRPFLLIECASLFGVSGHDVVNAAAALECVHAYSLVHDDLPAMDNDDLRRGQPTVHRAYDEATAILAGDALLTLAFDILASLGAPPAMRVELVALLSRAAGVGGMAGGQQLDMDASAAPRDEAATRKLQAMKTGALFRCACEAGAVLGSARSGERAVLRNFGEAIGLAYQVADDLLDATGSAETTGKSTAKDAGRAKATFVAHRGVAGARALLTETIAGAVKVLAPYGQRANVLVASARFIGERER
jgi:farnesyl diphosphate synthase